MDKKKKENNSDRMKNKKFMETRCEFQGMRGEDERNVVGINGQLFDLDLGHGA